MITSHILSKGTKACSRESGNAVLLSILLLSLLAALATAQFSVVHRNIQASSYFLSHSDLHKYAENGVDLAVHDLNYDISGDGGKVGTTGWTTLNDYGRDGTPGTYDQGESDGIPTPGEPNVNLAAIGDPGLGAGLIVHVADTGFANVFRVVAIATDGTDALSTVDTFVVKTTPSLPQVGPVYVDPEVALDLKGNAFKIDGNDYKANGTIDATKPKQKGILTEIGDTPEENLTNLLAQIPSKNYDQIVGLGANPSIGETTKIDIDALFDSFKAVATNTYSPGTYSNVTWGTLASMKISYVSGNLHLSGNGKAAGVLLVDGSLDMTGQFTHYGLIIVRGDVKMSGGGSGKHVYGSVMVGQSLTAMDEDVTISGTADLFYSSETLGMISTMLKPHYAVAYYDDK